MGALVMAVEPFVRAWMYGLDDGKCRRQRQ